MDVYLCIKVVTIREQGPNDPINGSRAEDLLIGLSRFSSVDVTEDTTKRMGLLPVLHHLIQALVPVQVHVSWEIYLLVALIP